MEISFWLVLTIFGIMAIGCVTAFLVGWFLGAGAWDERTAGYQGQLQDLRSRLSACETSLVEERAVSGEAQQADLERRVNPQADVLRGEIAALRAKLNETPPVAGNKDPEVPGDNKETVLERIRQNAAKLDFDRIGRFNDGDQSDDLQRIKGIGPFIQEKLHSAGIRTFRQIASFTPEDADMVNDIIEFFPGRVKREEWPRQARELLG